MASTRINPTRMELLRLKKRNTLAKKGHKLLKEKRDGLMQEFLKIVQQVNDLRTQVDEALSVSLKEFILAEASMDPKAVEHVSKVKLSEVKLEADEENVMGVRIPKFDIAVSETGESYPVWETSAWLDTGTDKLKDVLPKLLELAAIEKSAQLLAQEIEKTRRRVNALEYVLIPQLNKTIKYIRMKLDEQERAGIITTMVVKDKIE